MSQLAYKAQIFRGVRRLVLKVGSGVLADDDGARREVVGRSAAEVALQMRQGRNVIVATSGAVAAGKIRLGTARNSGAVVFRQAAAAVGQIELMRIYSEELSARGLL